MIQAEDPVFQDTDGQWYFWNEVWVDKYGPYSTREEAERELTKYCKESLGI